MPASLWRRAGAVAIDWAVALIIARLVLPGVPYGSGASALATMGAFFVEVTILTWLTTSSFGQRLVGISIVGVDGQRLGLWRVVIRTLLICVVIPALVYNSQGRGLQDIIAGSVALMRRTIPGLGR